MRKVARSMAKAAMKKAGMSGVCDKHNDCVSPAAMKRGKKHDYGRSYFSDSWRKASGYTREV